MKSEYKLNDTLNLRDLIETVTEHIRSNGNVDLQPRTMLSFLNTLLCGLDLSNGSVENWISTLQKILSGNISYTKAEPLAKQICSGSLDDGLLTNLSTITSAISRMQEDSFYQRLMQRVSLRFFTTQEKDELQKEIDAKQYQHFLLILLKHSFARLQNIPCFFAERIYEEALTYDFDSKLRFALMREAALNGNKNAALEYGNYLAKSGPYEEAFEYLLLALPLQPAMWNLAFLIEKRWIGHEQAKRCRLELKIEDKLSGKEFAEVIDELDGLTCLSEDHVRSEEIVYVYKIYFYLAKKGFYKACNSMAKLLLTGVVCFSGNAGKEKVNTLWKKYLQTAISGNNVTAMSNEGNRILIERTEKDLFSPHSTEEKYMVELLSIGSDMEFMHSCYYLGKYYEYALAHGQSDITRNDIKRVYERAAKLDQDGSGMSGQLYLSLGKLSDLPEEQVLYFEKALAAGLSDAAYALAMSYYEMSESSHNTRYLLKATKLLDDNILFMSQDVRENASALQRVIASLIQRL